MDLLDVHFSYWRWNVWCFGVMQTIFSEIISVTETIDSTDCGEKSRKRREKSVQIRWKSDRITGESFSSLEEKTKRDGRRWREKNTEGDEMKVVRKKRGMYGLHTAFSHTRTKLGKNLQFEKKIMLKQQKMASSPEVSPSKTVKTLPFFWNPARYRD